MLNFFTLCIDFLPYMSIIISVEREGIRDIPLGMKEMKEMKEIELNYIDKKILQDSLDYAFWEVMDARIYFLDELLYSDFMDYTLDMAGDNNDLQILLDASCDPYVHPHIAHKISLYYKNVNDLMIDIKFYLIKKYGIDYNTELSKRKAKVKAKERR